VELNDLLTPQLYVTHIGHYRVTTLESMPDKVTLHDTRTGEGGTFSRHAVTRTLEGALDTFFVENF
jgi:hypothetical protein